VIYTPLTRKAMELCLAAHGEQRDKGGYPYIFHPIHLAEQMPDEYSVIAALLHDVAEDTDCTLEEIAAMGFPAPVMTALALLCHDPAVPYLEYVAALKRDPIARRVKLADLRHNSDTSRLPQLNEQGRARLEKYRAAIALLEK